MAHPKRKHSKQRSRKRRTHDALKPHFGDLNPAGNKQGYNHRVDPITGYYKGRLVIDVSPRQKKKKGANEEKEGNA